MLLFDKFRFNKKVDLSQRSHLRVTTNNKFRLRRHIVISSIKKPTPIVVSHCHEPNVILRGGVKHAQVITLSKFELYQTISKSRLQKLLLMFWCGMELAQNFRNGSLFALFEHTISRTVLALYCKI